MDNFLAKLYASHFENTGTVRLCYTPQTIDADPELKQHWVDVCSLLGTQLAVTHYPAHLLRQGCYHQGLRSNVWERSWKRFTAALTVGGGLPNA